MKVVSSKVFVHDNNGPLFWPHVRYVVPNQFAQDLVTKTPVPFRVSEVNSYERRYGGHDLSGKRVCICRYHGIGDMLMVTALPKYLKYLYPDCEVDFYCMESYAAPVWIGHPFVEAHKHIPLPLPLDGLREYDYHILLDGMIEMNGEPDQANAYDDMFSFCGLEDVPVEFKQPLMCVVKEDFAETDKLGLDLTEPYIVYQTTSSTPVRDYPPDKGAEVVDLLLRRCPRHKVVITGENEIRSFTRFRQLERVIYLSGQVQHWRSLIPVIMRAKAVITPDTGIGHIAACFPDVPVVSIWGPFTADSRVKYYANHHPLEKVGTCPSQPCWRHGQEVPRDKCAKCPGYSDKSANCAAIAAITPEEIVEEVVKWLE